MRNRLRHRRQQGRCIRRRLRRSTACTGTTGTSTTRRNSTHTLLRHCLGRIGAADRRVLVPALGAERQERELPSLHGARDEEDGVAVVVVGVVARVDCVVEVGEGSGGGGEIEPVGDCVDEEAARGGGAGRGRPHLPVGFGVAVTAV